MRGQIFFMNKQQNPSTATELIHLALRIVIEKIRVCKTGSEELLTGSEELLIDCGKLQYSSRNLQAIFSKLQR